MWIKNTEGKPDAMLTFAAIAFFIITLNIFLSSVGTINYGEMHVTFQALDSSIMTVYLGSTFSAYVTRRLTDKHYVSSSEAKSEAKAENF